MVETPKILVLQSKEAQETSIRDKNLVFSYTLKEPIEFSETAYARLLSLGGESKPCLVFTDFVKRAQVNGTLEPFLGSSRATVTTPWVPLLSKHLPFHGVVYLRREDGSNISANANITAVIQIAPQSWIHGATFSPTRV